MALIMSKSEAVAKGNESKNGWMGKTAGPVWLYTDWKCLLNSSATSAGWILRLLDGLKITFSKYFEKCLGWTFSSPSMDFNQLSLSDRMAALTSLAVGREFVIKTICFLFLVTSIVIFLFPNIGPKGRGVPVRKLGMRVDDTSGNSNFHGFLNHTHTHTHIYIVIYVPSVVKVAPGVQEVC
jgi:hypothetical protein